MRGDPVLQGLREVRCSTRAPSSLTPPTGRSGGLSKESWGSPFPLRTWTGAKHSMLGREGAAPAPARPPSQASISLPASPPQYLFSLLQPQVCVFCEDHLVCSAVPWLAWPPCGGVCPGGL